MNDVHEFCRRMLGEGDGAVQAAEEALATGASDRLELLSWAVRTCRRAALPDPPGSEAPPNGGPDVAPGDLAATVAREMAQATARLPERQREALALRELLKLSYEQIARVMELDRAAVAPLLGRARLSLRALRRGVAAAQGGCVERERALRVLSARQDSEPLSTEDDRWLFEHLAACEQCSQAHAAMLEASVCYRAWPTGPR